MTNHIDPPDPGTPFTAEELEALARDVNSFPSMEVRLRASEALRELARRGLPISVRILDPARRTRSTCRHWRSGKTSEWSASVVNDDEHYCDKVARVSKDGPGRLQITGVRFQVRALRPELGPYLVTAPDFSCGEHAPE